MMTNYGGKTQSNHIKYQWEIPLAILKLNLKQTFYLFSLRVGPQLKRSILQVLPTSAKRSKLEMEQEVLAINNSAEKSTKPPVTDSNQKSLVAKAIDKEGSPEILQTEVAPVDCSNVTDFSVDSTVSPKVVENSAHENKQLLSTGGEVNLTVGETDVEASDTRILINSNGKDVEFLISGEANMETVKQLVEQLVKSGTI